MQGLLIDVDGVLSFGEAPLPGAARTLRWLSEEGIPHLFLTNTTSIPRRVIAASLRSMGLEVAEASVITPCVAARRWLEREQPGPLALFVTMAAREDFAGLPQLDDEREEGAGAVVLGDLGRSWDYARLNRAFRLLMDDARPVLIALGKTRYWRSPEGFELDVAPFAAALEHACGRSAEVLGKPARAFFHLACDALGLPASELAMIGDDLVTDVGAAQDAGLLGVLVKTGKFRPKDLVWGPRPDVVLDSFAELPERWSEIVRR